MSENNYLYRTLWRWHFYAGLFCIPFILILSATGAIYLFKPQIDGWVDRKYNQLDSGGARSSPTEQIQAALSDVPNSEFLSYRIPESESHAVVVSVLKEGKRELVYINPYSLEVMKQIAYNEQFIRIVRALHGELLLGTVGSVVVELAGCWAIVMIITGLYLWWPRGASGLAGVLYPRINSGGRRFWRDIHSVLGIWLSFFTLFLLITGLPWALVWGSAFKEIRSLSKAPVTQDWSVRDVAYQNNSGVNISLFTSKLLLNAQQLSFAHPAELSQDRKNPMQWKLSSQHQNRTLRADAWFDLKTGELLKVKTFNQKKTLDKAIGIGIAAHEGHLFGWFNQVLGVFVTVGLVMVSISGFILWRKRKPQGRLGAPPVATNSKASKIVFYITLGLSVVLPLLFVSLLVLLLMEKMVLRHLPLVRHWLGLAELA